MGKRLWDIGKISLEDDNGTLILRNEAGQPLTISPGGGVKGQFLTITAVGDTPRAWTNMPAALTEFRGVESSRVRVDLSGMNQWRMTVGVHVAGAAGSVLGVQHFHEDATFLGLDDGELILSANNRVPIDALGSFSSSWMNLFPSATTETTLRIVGEGGNGVADPEIVFFMIQFR